MEGEMKTFKAVINAHGFTPGVDISNEDWEKAKAEFMAMQNTFAYMSNQILEKVNDIWQRYETMKRVGNCVVDFLMQQEMEINEHTTYGDWVEKWYKDVCEAVDAVSVVSGFSLRSHLFRENDMPLFGAKFETKPEWWMDLELLPVD